MIYAEYDLCRDDAHSVSSCCNFTYGENDPSCGDAHSVSSCRDFTYGENNVCVCV